MMRVLEGFRVLDMTIWQQGPIATTMLADMGAEVIKIEPRITGDPGRGIMTILGATMDIKGVNFYFENNNRGKKGITLDLRKDKAKKIIAKLVEKSDVFVQNFRQGVAEKLGVDYSTLSQINPRLIYCSVTGYGARGPESAKTSLDVAAQARSGIMFAAMEPGLPTPLVGGFADQVGGTFAAFAVVMALLARERFGIGQEVITSHLGSMIWLQGLSLACRLMLETQIPKIPRSEARNCLWNYYGTKDGKWLQLGMLQGDRYWPIFCKAMGLEQLEKDPRFADMAIRAQNAKELISILDTHFLTKTRDEWFNILGNYDLIFDRAQDYDDLLNDPQAWINNYFTEFDHPNLGPTKLVGVPFELTKTPGDARAAAPEFGQNTEEVLLDVVGYSWEDIEKLREEEVI